MKTQGNTEVIRIYPRGILNMCSNVTAVHQIVNKIFHVEPYGGARGKFRGSPELFGFAL